MPTMHNDWPIRSIERAGIVESLLHYHFGWTFSGTATDQAVREVEDALDCWLELGLRAAVGTGAEQLFDPVEVTNFMIAAGHRGEHEFWERNYVATQRGQFLAQQGMAPDSREAPDITLPAPRRYHVRLEREYNLAGVPLGSKMRLRLPVPIEDHALRDLAVEYRLPPGGTARLQPARLDVSLTTADPGPLTIGFEARFEALIDVGGNGTLDDRERDLYTRPREMLIRVDDRTAGIARKLASGKGDEWARVMAIFDYLIDNFRIGAVPYHALDPEAPADWTFRTGIFDCHVSAALFCAMCRSVGIPARLTNGYLLFPLDLSYHYWAEVWIKERGWVGFDFTVWQLSRGGRDPDWRNLLAGTLDYRVKTQVFPDMFTGPGSIRLPPAWHLLSFRHDDVFETVFVDAISGATVYSDRLSLV